MSRSNSGILQLLRNRMLVPLCLAFKGCPILIVKALFCHVCWEFRCQKPEVESPSPTMQGIRRGYCTATGCWYIYIMYGCRSSAVVCSSTGAL